MNLICELRRSFVFVLVSNETNLILFFQAVKKSREKAKEIRSVAENRVATLQRENISYRERIHNKEKEIQTYKDLFNLTVASKNASQQAVEKILKNDSD